MGTMRISLNRGRTALLVFVALAAAALSAPAAHAAAPVIHDPSSSATQTQATLAESYDSDAANTTYHFEYGTTTAYGTSTADATSDVGAFLPANAGLTGLTASTEYHWRLVVSNDDGTTAGDDQTFTTTAVAAPTVGAALTGRGTTSATVAGSVNAQSLNTTWRVEYGPTSAYGSTAPVPDGTTTSETDQPVTATLAGLTPGTLYHWRLTATNSEGTTATADRRFTTQVNSLFTPGPALPSGRAYELVSPYDTGGDDAVLQNSAGGWADGNHAVFETVASFAGQANGVVGYYVSTRTASGWQTKSVSDPTVNDSAGILLSGSPDLSSMLVEIGYSGGLFATGKSSLQRVTAAGRTTLHSWPDGQQMSWYFQDASSDTQHVFLASSPSLLPQDTHTNGSQLYEVDGTTLKVVGLVNGAVPPCGAVLPVAKFAFTGSGTNLPLGTGAVSPDGGTYYFLSPDPGAGGACAATPTPDLYVSHDGTSTNISGTADPANDHGATFLATNADRSVVYFTTTNALEASDTNNDTDIYRYAVGAANPLTRVTTGEAGDDDANISGSVVSADGSHVYFTTPNAFDGHGTDGSSNLFVWTTGGTKFVRSIDGLSLPAPVTPDGRHIVLATTTQLTSYDNAGTAADLHLRLRRRHVPVRLLQPDRRGAEREPVALQRRAGDDRRRPARAVRRRVLRRLPDP